MNRNTRKGERRTEVACAIPQMGVSFLFPQPTRDENQSVPTGRKAIGLSHQEQRKRLGPSRSNLAHHPRQPGPRSHRHCPLLPQRPRALCSSQSHIALLVVVEGADEPRCGQRAGLHEGQQASALNSGEWVGGSLPATGRNSLIDTLPSSQKGCAWQLTPSSRMFLPAFGQLMGKTFRNSARMPQVSSGIPAIP